MKNSAWFWLVLGWLLISQGYSQDFRSVNGTLDRFQQGDTGDCFFLASLIALNLDPEGRQAIESVVKPDSSAKVWRVEFISEPASPIWVSAHELGTYRLKNSAGDGFSQTATGDPDVKLLEIAADKYWKINRKPEGLWDDVPMNAVAMFTLATQHLIWNPAAAKPTTLLDIAKYRAHSRVNVVEHRLDNEATVARWLREFVSSDVDGLSLILMDYHEYHALVIDKIDFDQGVYSIIDTQSGPSAWHSLNSLLEGLVEGIYALDYFEVE